MPSSVADVLAAAGLGPGGVVGWGDQVPERRAGVYVVALTEDPSSTAGGLLASPPLSFDAIERWLHVRPELTLDGDRPTVHQLADRLKSFWMPDEAIVYIGLTTRPLCKRVVEEYYKTPLGAKRPHSGGYFLKALGDLSRFHLHFAAADDPGSAEAAMLGAFCTSVSEATREALLDPAHPFPFANLEWPRGTRKDHRISGARGEMPLAAGKSDGD